MTLPPDKWVPGLTIVTRIRNEYVLRERIGDGWATTCNYLCSDSQNDRHRRHPATYKDLGRDHRDEPEGARALVIAPHLHVPPGEVVTRGLGCWIVSRDRTHTLFCNGDLAPIADVGQKIVTRGRDCWVDSDGRTHYQFCEEEKPEVIEPVCDRRHGLPCWDLWTRGHPIDPCSPCGPEIDEWEAKQAYDAIYCEHGWRRSGSCPWCAGRL